MAPTASDTALPQVTSAAQKDAQELQPPVMETMNCSLGHVRPGMPECTALLQVLLPLAPGVESIWEPLKEEFEESRDKVEQRYRDVMEGGLWHAFCGLPLRMGHDCRHCSCLSRQPLLVLCSRRGRCCRQQCVLRCFTSASRVQIAAFTMLTHEC